MIIKGRACVVRTKDDHLQIREGDVVVAFNATPDMALAINKVAAMAVEVDNKLCHAAIIAREAGKPLVMGMEGIVKEFKTGDTIVIDTDRKTVFKA